MKLLSIITLVFIIHNPTLSQNLKLVPPVGHTDMITSIQFSQDSKLIASASEDGTIKIWDVASGELIHKKTGYIKEWSSASQWPRNHHFSPDSKMILSAGGDQSIKIFDISSGNLIRQIKIEGDYMDLNFKQDFLLSYRNPTLNFHRISDGKELFSFIPIDSTDWVVIDPEGRFDATPNAMNLMHFVTGNEIIEFQQLKDRFYEPGLAEKILRLIPDVVY